MKYSYDGKPYKSKEESKHKDIAYYECRKPCHIKPNCPTLKKLKGKHEKKNRTLKT